MTALWIVAGFIAYAAVITAAVLALRWAGRCRSAGDLMAMAAATQEQQDQARPSAPGPAPHPGAGCPPRPGGAKAQEVPSLRVPAPGQFRARESYRAPGDASLGTCLITSHLYDSGVCVVLDHARKRRIEFHPPADEETDEAFFARIEREMRRQ